MNKIGGEKLSKRFFKSSALSLLILCLFSFSLAQRQTGSIRGTVIDQEGAPLPGATVTVSGATLLGSLTYVTSEAGNFRFPALPPGTYRLTAEMPGFKAVTLEGIDVHVGKTSSVEIKLEPAALEEEVTVTAEAPVVDTTSSKVSVNYTADLIQNIPIGRNVNALVNTAPGVISDVGAYSTSRFSSHGSSVRGNSHAFDGFLVEDPLVGGLLVPVNFDTFEEVEVELTAHPAEVGQAHGSYVNVVTKSGGNNLSGLAQVYYTSKDMVDKNFNEDQIRTFSAIAPKGPTGEPLITPTKTVSDLDLSLNLGGPILKDRLWFFAAFRYFDATLNYTGFNDPVKRTPLDQETTNWNFQGKLTSQLHPNHRLTLNWYRSGGKALYHAGYVSPYTLPEAVPELPGLGTSTLYAVWNGIINQNTFFDLRVGYLDSWYPIRFPSEEKLGPNLPGMMFGVQHVDLISGFTYGAPVCNQNYDRERLEFLGSLTRFADNLIGGSHEFKLGFEFELAKCKLEHWFPYEPSVYSVYTANYRYMLTALGLPFGMLFPLAIGSKEGDSQENDYIYRWSAYLQDSFTVTKKLTINAGIRWDYYRPTIPAQKNTGNPFWHNIIQNGMVLWLIPYQPQYFGPKEYEKIPGVVNWSTFSPRLGLTYDPFGDGKTSLKASYSKYYEPFSGQISGLINPNYWHGMLFYWYDLNRNNWPDLADFFIAGYQYGRIEDPVTGLPDVDTFYDKNIRPTYAHEVTVGVEREIFPNFSLGLNYIKKWSRDIIEMYNRIEGTIYTQDTMREPGPDGIFGTSDDISFPVYVGSGNAPVGWLTNIDGKNGKPLAERKYEGVELIINKKLSHKWQLFGSVVLSKSTGNIGQSYLASYYGTEVFMDPNYQVNRYGRLDLDRPLVIKLAGTYMVPYGINFSFYFTHYSGLPYNRNVRVYGLAPWASSATVIATNPPGTYRRPSRDNLDLRVEKSFRLGPGSLGLFLDIFNALNSGYFDYNSDYAGDMYYGVPGVFIPNRRYLNEITGLSSPRVLKISIRYSF